MPLMQSLKGELVATLLFQEMCIISAHIDQLFPIQLNSHHENDPPILLQFDEHNKLLITGLD